MVLSHLLPFLCRVGSFIGRVVRHGLIPDHLLQLVLRWLEVVPGPVERIRALVVGQVDVDEKLFEVGVLQAVFHRVTFLRVEDEHLLKQAVGVGVRFGENLLHCLLVALGQLSNVATRQIVPNEAHIVTSRRSKHCNRSFDLVKVVVSWEQWRPAEKLRKDAAEGPDVEGVGVVTGVQDDLGSSIPPSHNVLRQRGRRLLVASRETEIADFERAVLVEEQV